MPSFDLMNKVELFVRTGTFHVDASKTSKKVTRAASKHFIYKDGGLWRAYRGRLLRVVRSDDEVRELLIRYHDNNNHAGRVRTIREIMLMYYWVGVTEAVKTWIKACAACQSRTPAEPPEPRVLFCLAYGCDASSYVYPELDFHRFPKEAERRRHWLAVAQRDEGSLRSSSVLCSRHFEPLCYTRNDGQLTLSPDAVPTIIPVTEQEDEAPDPSDEDFLHPDSLEDLLSTAAETTEAFEPPRELQEHRYCLWAPGPDPGGVQTVSKHKKRNTVIEPSFTAYNQIARYLSHRVLPLQSKKGRSALKRMAKRFGLIDGQLMYTRVSPPVRVPRSREEVNSILQRFHDNQGHYGQGICQREITKHFYWASMTRDLARWISGCHTCLNRTKRKWLRCSVHNCTNCCGPVERGLGLTFHKFPLDNVALMDQWLKAVGRTNWHPRPRSSVCSTHFTEDCFDRSGDKVSVRPDAVPTLLVHSGSASPSRGPTQPAGGEETYFAKYDAVELYLRRRTYPPGLSYVEKNTFRRFCKKFSIKDDELHVVSGDQVRLVLRRRQQVEAALVDYHDELNHLDVNKCLRLLNQRYFWKTMRPDVLQWINSCSHCRNKRRKTTEHRTEPERTESLISGEDGDDDEDDVSVGDEEAKPAAHSGGGVVPPINPQPRIPILLHLRTPISLQPRTPIILQPRTPNAPFVARLWSLQRETNSSEVQVQVNPQPDQQTPPEDQKETSGSLNSARTHHYVKAQGATTDARPPAELPAKPKLPQAARRQVQSRGLKTQTQTSAAAGGKRRSSSYGLEPVVAPTTKPWPVFTIAGPAEAQTARLPPQVDSPADSLRTRKLQARTVIQQCSRAKVRTKPALDGADAQWAEIQEGMVVYVCFFHGASEDITHQMASSLMTTKLFRKESGHLISVLDLPGSILLVPQDSLTGEPLPKRRVQYKGGCEPWWGAQLFSHLVSTCRELMSSSVKCTRAGVKVEHGVYGQKQEMVLNSLEPLTLLLEF